MINGTPNKTMITWIIVTQVEVKKKSSLKSTKMQEGCLYLQAYCLIPDSDYLYIQH